MKWLFIAYFIVVNVRAEDVIQVLDPDLDTSSLEGRNVTIKRGIDPSKQKATLPTSSERDRIFKDAGIAETVKGWDQWDKDMLFRKGQQLSPKELKAGYPKLNDKQLKALVSLIKRSGW